MVYLALIAMSAVVAIILAGLLMVKAGDNKRLRHQLSELHKGYKVVAQDYVDILEKYERVQHGYDQGVLEGTRQGYVNVRAFLAANMERAEPAERAFLVTWLHPRLTELGEKENKLLLEMKGLKESAKEFRQATADKLGIEKEN